MSSASFDPRLVSTPKKTTTDGLILQNLCSTPLPAHVRRCSLAKCAPRPVDSSTPQTRRIKKSAATDLHRLMFPNSAAAYQGIKIWVL